MDIILATSNKGKVEDFKVYLDTNDLKYNVLCLSDLNYNQEIEEFGLTLEQNALIKAQAIADFYPNSIVIADDSGLEVSALDNKPGVYSARYASEYDGFSSNADETNIKKLLIELEHKLDRSAKFRTVLCIINKNDLPVLFEGIVKGEITERSSGTNGFGYDPIFSHNGMNTFAQLTIEEKAKISHRGNAIRSLIESGILW